MTHDKKRKTFDCVATMRRIRDRISSEIAGKTHDELVHWLHDHDYSDPVLQRLAIRRRPSESLDAAIVEQGTPSRTENVS
jgi:hypothetical protein